MAEERAPKSIQKEPDQTTILEPASGEKKEN